MQSEVQLTDQSSQIQARHYSKVLSHTKDPDRPCSGHGHQVGACVFVSLFALFDRVSRTLFGLECLLERRSCREVRGLVGLACGKNES